MKTNALARTVIAAVKKVSADKYKGNVILAKAPESLTKNVIRFTLKTKDKNAAGSIVDIAGKPLPRASKEVHQDVIDEIFLNEKRPNVYVDLINGDRQYSPIEHPAVMVPTRTKRKYTRRNKSAIVGKRKRGRPSKISKGDFSDASVNKLIKVLKAALKSERLSAA